MSSSSVLRQLKIKTGSVKRLVKDKEAYLKEAEDQRARVEEYRARGADDADIRKQNEVLEETIQMVPDTERRIRSAVQDLENVVASENPAFAGSQELVDALEAIKAAKEALPQ